MALNRKYADLPDLDLAPDVYETPELTDDASTVPPSTTVRSPSPFEEDSTNPENIDRHRLQPDQARSHFEPAQVDARGVDFSDSINGHRGSYRTYSRRRRRRDDGMEELGDLSDDEDESLERKLARLRREAEEVKAELERRRMENEEGHTHAGNQPEGLQEGVDGLSKLLDNLSNSTRGGPSQTSAEASLSKRLATSNNKPVMFDKDSNGTKPPPTIDQQQSDSSITSTLLSQASSFDQRLTLLETLLGAPPLSPTGRDSTSHHPHPVLPTLSTLTNQLTILTTTITPSPTHPSHDALEDLSTKIRHLRANADALTTARQRAAQSLKDLNDAESAHSQQSASSHSIPHAGPPSPTRRRGSHKNSISGGAAGGGGGGGGPSPSFQHQQQQQQQHIEDLAHTSKINALYNTLPVINSLAPVLPAVLERLRSLRALHAGAATAAQDLDGLERGLEDVRAEVERWRGGLESVEERIRDGEEAMKGNLEMVGNWVRSLEGRVRELGGE